MFQQKQEEQPVTPSNADTKMMNKYKNFIAATGTSVYVQEPPKENDIDKIEKLLEREKQSLGSEPWNKLDKRLKIQKLHAFAETFSKDNGLSHKEMKNLKTFFSECLSKDKLAKVKDVDYNKDTGVISSIPGLCMNAVSRAFTIRNLEKKVSTLKSLTPKKTIVVPDADADV